MLNTIITGDCLDVMKDIPDEYIDMILCDLPYGTTACKWDVIIPLDRMWEEYTRIAKKNAPIVLTASQPFTSILVGSNIKMFKYEWIWEKSKASNFLLAKKQPLKAHENILVFCKGTPVYYPQKTQGKPYSGEKRAGKKGSITDVYNNVPNPTFRRGSEDGTRYPRTVQYFATAEIDGQIHPTQKPISLFEYLIRTYTQEDDIVLDNCIGSGTTAIAAIKAGRNWIGVEKDEVYAKKAMERINKKV